MKDLWDLAPYIKTISVIEDKRTMMTKEFENYVSHILQVREHNNKYDSDDEEDEKYSENDKKVNKFENLNKEFENDLYLKKLEEYGKNTQDLNNETKEVINSLEKDLKTNNINETTSKNHNRVNFLIDNIKTLLNMEKKNFELLIVHLQLKIKVKNIKMKIDYQISANKSLSISSISNISNSNKISKDTDTNIFPQSCDSLNKDLNKSNQSNNDSKIPDENSECIRNKMEDINNNNLNDKNKDVLVSYLSEVEKTNEEIYKIENEIIKHRNNINEFLTEMKYQFI